MAAKNPQLRRSAMLSALTPIVPVVVKRPFKHSPSRTELGARMRKLGILHMKPCTFKIVSGDIKEYAKLRAWIQNMNRTRRENKLKTLLSIAKRTIEDETPRRTLIFVWRIR